MILTPKNDFFNYNKVYNQALKFLFGSYYSNRITPVTMAIESSSVFASSNES
jgi:hypothetical protein